jgi:hypothetical protein
MIPTIDWRKRKMKLVAWHKRKISAYIPSKSVPFRPITGKYPLILLFALRTKHPMTSKRDEGPCKMGDSLWRL